MSPVRIDASHFSPDTRAFFAALAAERVRYVVVGGEAVILHGHVRLTGDVDVYYSSDSENLRLLFAALESFWDGDVPGIDSPSALAPEGVVVQFGQPPNRIDLLNAIDGVSFDEAWAGHVEAVIVGEGDEIPIRFIGLDALIKNKRASGRPKDLDDLSYLGTED
ncbi:MAG TPA: nucleotidyltransferase [Longimicrobiales bacterium]|nr:nucleotidyltransferase [Longimicrobiales bacterium]